MRLVALTQLLALITMSIDYSCRDRHTSGPDLINLSGLPEFREWSIHATVGNNER